MLKKNTTKRSRSFALPLGLAVYLIIGALLACFWYRYQINPDGTSYISIAQSYAHFHIRQAINGYWGPFLSWVIVPFIWTHLSPIVAIKFINVAAGALILVLLWFTFARGSKIGPVFNHLLLLGIAPLLLEWALTGPLTPDILFSLLLLSVSLLTYKLTRTLSVRYAVFTGLAGGLLYYTKSIGFFIFAIQLILVFGLLTVSRKSYKSLVKPFVLTLVVFALFIGPFVAVITIKYHRPLISTTAAYNHGIMAPQYGGRSVHPVDITGPFAPPHPQSYSAWEDPSFLPVPQWSTFANLHYVFSLVHNNLSSTQSYILSFGPLAAIGAAAAAVAFVLGVWFRQEPSLSSIMGIAILLVIAGYASLVVEARYLWCIVPLAFIALAYFLKFQVKSNIFAALILATLVAVSIWSGTETIMNNRNVNKSDYQIAQSLASYLPPRSKITADTFASIDTCYFDNLACYGIIAPASSSTSDRLTEEAVKKLGITYFVDYGSVQANPQLQNFLHHHASIYHTVSSNGAKITIYRFR